MEVKIHNSVANMSVNFFAEFVKSFLEKNKIILGF